MNPETTAAVNVPLCIHCRHFEPYPGGDVHAQVNLAKCLCSAEIFNPLDGTQHRRFCENERGPSGSCGFEGKNWQPDDSDITL